MSKLTPLDYEMCFNVVKDGWYSGFFPLSEMDMSPQELLDTITRQEAETMGNRDTFAMAAMQGLLANGPSHSSTPDDVAKLAYQFADAMIAFKDREIEEMRKESEETYNAQQEAWREANKKQSP